MSAKYESQKIIYESAVTRVELVRHKQLGDLRICKSISMQTGSSSDIFQEAEMLSQLRHPGIPMIYDIEVNESSVCLVEEYIQGQSLAELLLYQDSISPNTLLEYAIQLCEIIEFLHERKPYPILYQDMKPDHIIVCGNQIKLIDYGIAIFLTNQGENFQKYGTKAYAAPEQQTAGALDERCDVYSVGKVLQLLMQHSSARHDLRLWLAVRRATEEKPCRRTPNIAVLKEQLVKIYSTFNKQKQDEHLLSIAVVGSEKGVGCTHFAMAFTKYLNCTGHRAFYMDMLETTTLARLVRRMPVFSEKQGVIYHDNFFAVASYGPCIKKEKPPLGIRVMDCGTNVQPAVAADRIIYVCSGTPWKVSEELPDWIEDDRCMLVCSHYSIPCALHYARQSQKKVYGFPLDRSPFHMTIGKRRLFRALVRDGRKAKTEWEDGIRRRQRKKA